MNVGYRQRKHSSQWTKLIYIGAIVGPLFILPQVFKIWTEQDATGVSAFTWGGYLFGAFFWGIYGFVHKEKPIVLANIMSATFVSLVLLGILLYS